jgi:hypothetical protein
MNEQSEDEDVDEAEVPMQPVFSQQQQIQVIEQFYQEHPELIEDDVDPGENQNDDDAGEEDVNGDDRESRET